MIAVFNLVLWIAAVAGLGRNGSPRQWRSLAAPAYAAIILALAACLAPNDPDNAELMWYLTLLGPFIDARVAPVARRGAAHGALGRDGR